MKLSKFGDFPAVTGPYGPEIEAGAREWGEILNPAAVLLHMRHRSHPHARPPWQAAATAEALFEATVQETCDCADVVVPRIELTNALWEFQVMGRAFLAICLGCGEGFEVKFPDAPGIPHLPGPGYP